MTFDIVPTESISLLTELQVKEKKEKDYPGEEVVFVSQMIIVLVFRRYTR